MKEPPRRTDLPRVPELAPDVVKRLQHDLRDRPHVIITMRTDADGNGQSDTISNLQDPRAIALELLRVALYIAPEVFLPFGGLTGPDGSGAS